MKSLWTVIALVAIAPLVLWFLLDPDFSRFSGLSQTFYSIGRLAGLLGLALFSLNVILSSRFPGIERLFGPLNKISIVHHLLGISVWILLSIHPVGLFFVYGFGLFFPIFSNLVQKLGSLTFLLLSSLLTLTLFVRLPYHIWKLTHRYLGLVLLLGSTHAFLIGSDISSYLPLKLYFSVLITLALVAWLYHSSPLRKIFVKKYFYEVDSLEKIGRITQIFFKPVGKEIRFVPGQFAFFSFQTPGLAESHPFSLINAPGSPLGIAAKDVGDFTAELNRIPPKTKVILEGPYGRFSYVFHPRSRQIWIAGGIGITPFFSMAESLPKNTNFQVDLYYITHSQADAYGIKYLRGLAAKNSRLKIFHHQTGGKAGRLTADQVIAKSGDLSAADIFVCGPLNLMKAFRSRFNELGIRHSHIHTEEFSLN